MESITEFCTETRSPQKHFFSGRVGSCILGVFTLHASTSIRLGQILRMVAHNLQVKAELHCMLHMFINMARMPSFYHHQIRLITDDKSDQYVWP